MEVQRQLRVEEEEAVEVGLRGRHESRRQEEEETAATTTINGKDHSAAFTTVIESTDVITEITNKIPEFISKTEILTELPAPGPPLKTRLPEPVIQVNTSHINGTPIIGSITTMQESRQDYVDMYLEPTFHKQATQEFFCPNCNTCIRKVVLRDSDWQFVPSPPAVAPEPMVIPREPAEPIRCTSCFSFLIPVGSWFNTLIRVKKDEDGEEDAAESDFGRGSLKNKIPEVGIESSEDKEPPSEKLDDQNKKGSETNKDPLPLPSSEKLDDQNNKGLETNKDPLPFVRIGSELCSEDDEQIEDDIVNKARTKQEPTPLEEVVIHGKTSEETKKSGYLCPITEIPEKTKAKEKEKEETKKSSKGPVEKEVPRSTPTIAGPSASSEAEASTESGRGDNWDILMSIVYGGLAESITSLSVVTSAAGANVSSLKVIAMALANLIGGLFVVIYNIWDLKAEQARTVLNETNEEVDRYQKLLGQRKNFALHATFVLLSFLVFGIEPPLVYGFSFRESNNRDYKLAVVAGASFLCISLLALGKAHIQKPSSYHAYLKTLVFYLVIGFAASGVSYVAGDLIRKLLDKLGLFKSESEAAIFLAFNDASAGNPTWSSY